MKRILPFLILLLSLLSASAADQIVECTITVTNFSGIATNGTDTLTVNAETRTATNNITSSPSTLFLGTNSMLHGKTNLFNHLALFPIGSAGTRLTLINVGTNSFKLRGQLNQAISASVGGVWGTVALSTNTVTNFTAVTVPLEFYTAAEGTNVAFELTRFFSLASNAVAAAASGLTNHLNQFLHQQASNKLFFASTNRAGAIEDARQITGTNVALTNVVLAIVNLTGVTNLSGYLAALTNGYLTNVIIETDRTNRFGKVVIPSGGGITIGSTSAPPIFVSGFLAAGTFPTVQLQSYSDTATDHAELAFQRARGGEGNPTNVLSGDTVSEIEVITRGLTLYRSALRFTTAAYGDVTDSSVPVLATISIGRTNSGTVHQTVMGFSATDWTNGCAAWFHSNLTALATTYLVDARIASGWLTNVTGYFAQIAWTNALGLGGSISNTHIRESSLSNVLFAANGTNVFAAGADISFGRSTVTSVANGHNTIDVGTNVYVDLTGSPTAAWTWGGITGGNRDGKLVKIRNSTGYPADILHNSGTEPTAALRISTPTTTNITLHNLGWAEFLYDATASRWQLANVFNTATPAASATNALASLSTNGVQVTAAWTNLNVIYGTNVVLRTTNTSGNVDLRISAESQFTGTTNAIALRPTGAHLPATNMAIVDRSLQQGLLSFPRTNGVGSAVALSALFDDLIVPDDYATNTLRLELHSLITATNGPNSSNVIWQATILRHNTAGQTSTNDAQVGPFDAGSSTLTTTWTASFNGTNRVQVTSVQITNCTLAAGESFILKLERLNATDATIANAALTAARFRYTRP